MSHQEKAFLQQLKLTLILILTPALLGIIITAVAFYFNTKNALANTNKEVVRQGIELEKKPDVQLINLMMENINGNTERLNNLTN
jgi:hypothetical protein